MTDLCVKNDFDNENPKPYNIKTCFAATLFYIVAANSIELILPQPENIFCRAIGHKLSIV